MFPPEPNNPTIIGLEKCNKAETQEKDFIMNVTKDTL